jgi:cell volume regulation protein A
VVFFVVLISATLQGSTLPLSARKLGLSEPAPAAPAATLEITALNDINADIVEYTLGEHSRAAGQLLARMALPDSTVVAMITRQNMVIPPRGSTTLQKGDHLFVVMRPDTRAHVDFVFSDKEEVSPEEMPAPEVALRGSTTIDDIRRCYGLQLPGAGYLTLADVIRAQENQPTEGTTVTIEHFTLVVQSMIGNRIATVLLQCATDADSVS